MTNEMQRLIDLALADKVLEEMEVSLLRRRAKEFGDDPDEVEMTVKALLAKSANSAAKPDGICPNCGAPTQRIMLHCPSCGFELARKQAKQTLDAFKQQLFDLTAQERVGGRHGITKFIGGSIVLFFFLMAAAVIAVTFSPENEIDVLTGSVVALLFLVSAVFVFRKTFFHYSQQKKFEALVNGFLIPTDLEEVFDTALFLKSMIEPVSPFMALISFEARKKQFKNKLWRKKIQQLRTKAEIIFGGSPETMQRLRSILV